MSVINKVIQESTRKRTSFSEAMRNNGWTGKLVNINSYDYSTEDFSIIDINKLSDDKLNKNSSTIYIQNFQSLLTFLPAELVEKILKYETYGNPMINVYKEMVMCMKHPWKKHYLNIYENTKRRFTNSKQCNLIRRKEVLRDLCEEKRVFVEYSCSDSVLYRIGCNLKSNIEKYNIPYLYKQLDNPIKNMDGFIKYIIGETNLDINIPKEDILADIKNAFGGEYQYFSQLLFKQVLDMKNLWIKLRTNERMREKNHEILKADEFGRYLEWDFSKVGGYNILGRYGLSSYDVRNGTKEDVRELLQQDFDRNKILIEFKKSWSKKKIIKLWLEEGKEIFLKEHKKLSQKTWLRIIKHSINIQRKCLRYNYKNISTHKEVSW